MKSIFFPATVLTFGALIILGLTPNALSGQSSIFFRDLSLGSRGEDVRELQKWLNKSTETEVSAFGPGSLGNETDYFGERTKAAVKRYQEAHRETILYPNGLLRGTGYFGPATRSSLNGEILADTTNETPDLVNAQAESQGNAAPPQSQEPFGIEAYVDEVRRVGEDQGFSEKELALVEKELRSIVATTTDLEQLFIEQVRASGIAPIPVNHSQSERKEGKKLTSLFRPLVEALFPKAHALLPAFGGPVLATIPCTCTGGAIWSVLIGPPRPILGDYIIGTQLYLSYNFPFPEGIYALGLFIPGAVGSCLVGAPPFCVPFPSVGLITPITGSSLVPGL